MIKVLTGIALGALTLAALLWLPRCGIYALVFGMVTAGLIEFGRMFFSDAFERWTVVIAGMALALWMMGYDGARELTPLALVAILFAMALIFMWRTGELAGTAGRLGTGLLGAVYLGMCLPFWLWLFELPGGRHFLLLAIVPACLCDIFAMAAGKAIGRHKFAPRVSPNKTVEGFFGALVGSMAGVFVVGFALGMNIGVLHLAGLALVIWITSPFGDLIESLIKRSCGVKDSGSIIPGHGGVLDRLDALVFTGPAAYAYVKYVIGV